MAKEKVEKDVVVEDVVVGIEAAKAGGFFAVGLGISERLAEANIVLPNLKGVHLVDLLKDLGIELIE